MQFSLFATGVAVSSAALLAVAGPAYRLGVPLPAAFSMLRWAAYVALASMALALVAGALSWRRRQRLAVAVAALALVVGAVSFGIPYLWQQRAQAAPPIHDVTTDLENPPAFEAIVPLRAAAPNTLDRAADLAATQRRAYPDLQPITLAQPADQVFETALALAQDRGWQIATADRSAGRIEATDTTRWFGFQDDIVIRLTPWGSGTRVDMRSVSRLGLGDAGTNARRIEDFLGELE